MVHQPIVEGMRRFGCATKFRELVAGQGKPAAVIDSVGWGEIEVL